MNLVVLNVGPTEPLECFSNERQLQAWQQTTAAGAQRFINGVVHALRGPNYTAGGRVATGDATDMIARDVGLDDLLVVSSHGRTGMHPLIFGSVSHPLVHRVAGSVLVVR